MASKFQRAPGETLGDQIVGMVAAEGSAAHGYARRPARRADRHGTRDLADAAHYLCVLHGRFPGVIDYAAERSPFPAAADWLAAAAAGFTQERAYLAKLVVAAGPLPSTPGQAESEAAVLAQRHALGMLAQSDRTGCALGAAVAMVLDWKAVRAVLDGAAGRFGVPVARLELPDGAATRAMVDAVAASAAMERALRFGAQQILVQHRGLWDLLETRQGARAEL